jgi:outer membrane protein OmpA-like peptidoglycan-associated protein
MKIKAFMVAALAVVSLSATAQRQEKVIDRVNQRTVQELDHQDVSVEFKKHAFFNIMGGAQYTLGEAKFSDLLSPNVEVGLGYQFSPIFAARLQANAWQSKGGWNGYGNPPLTKDYKWNYVAPGIDLMLNLSNLICGYNPERVFNVSAFVGAGANIGWGNDDVNDIAKNLKASASTYELEYLWDGSKVRPFGRGGIELGIRLSDNVQFNIEGNANILSDKYNSKKADNADWYFNGLIGLRFNLGGSSVRETRDVYRDVIVYDTIYKYVTIQDPVVRVEPMRQDIFFEINKWEIRDSEAQKVKALAEFLKKYPKATVMMTGYADVETGNDRINDKLGAERVKAVKDALVGQYGIDESRITTDSKGAREQPFAENEKNRVTIAVAQPE